MDNSSREFTHAFDIACQEIMNYEGYQSTDELTQEDIETANSLAEMVEVTA